MACPTSLSPHVQCLPQGSQYGEDPYFSFRQTMSFSSKFLCLLVTNRLKPSQWICCHCFPQGDRQLKLSVLLCLKHRGKLCLHKQFYFIPQIKASKSSYRRALVSPCNIDNKKLLHHSIFLLRDARWMYLQKDQHELSTAATREAQIHTFPAGP